MKRISRSIKQKPRFPFTEMVVVVVALAALAAIAFPKLLASTERGKEAVLKNDLKLLRHAVTLFYTHTGLYPLNLSDLQLGVAPAKGLDSSGNRVELRASDWRGPYIDQLPSFPISGGDWAYGKSAPDVGKITVSGPSPYDSW